MSAGAGAVTRSNDPFKNFDYNDAAKEIASPPRKAASPSPSPEPGPGASSSLLRDLINGCDGAGGELPTLPDDESPQKAPNTRKPLKKQVWYAQTVPNVAVKQDRPDKDFEKRAADSIMRSLRQSSKAKQPGMYYNVKHESLPDGSPAKSRGWTKNLYVVQMGHLMLFFKKQDEATNRQLAGPCFLYVNSPYVTIPTDYTKKKVLRIRTFNKGTFLMEPVAHGVNQLKNRIENPPVTVMDTTHFKSDESIADLDLFHKRQDGTGQARDDIQPVGVLLLGLAKSGKTSLLKRMLGEKFVEDRAASTTISTATVNWSKGVSFTFVDPPGSRPQAWPVCYLPTDTRPAPYAIIFVIDSTAVELLPRAKQELHTLLDEPALRDTLFILQLNKHGNTEPMAESSSFILQALGVAKGSNHHLVLTTASCRHGTGIVEPLQYLVGSLPSFTSF